MLISSAFVLHGTINISYSGIKTIRYYIDVTFPIFRSSKGENFKLFNQLIGCEVPACMLMFIETASLLFMASIAIDKALSLARPLHYSDIVTYLSVNVYVIAIFLISLLVGVILPLSAFKNQPINKPEVNKCFIKFGIFQQDIVFR